ncbi:DUF2868 domain-containing protein [Pseudomonas matsuisoli]|uniref:DUF2868 domain-containing protein n=1 Tax=Pseudomonas matsuisoli TaxID=1515666 RepID=A0A917PX72_9PSED|nr:DUF2868 domain-containing protein [Pseudomonas matsuisoli]GGJ96707.1 hypothetical protein GCM10009304_23260 [Pseudomonas matsuisoli]
MTSTPTPLSILDRLWLTEAVRLREEHTGPLDDSEANRHANVAGGPLAERIERRALFLAERDGQRRALGHWRQGAWLALLALMLVAILAGSGIAWSSLGDGTRPVNVFVTLGSLLGLHLVTLIGWLLGSVVIGDSGGALGRIWLWLSGKAARDTQAVQLAPALMHVLQQRRLTRWGLGTLVHTFWALLLLSGLATVLLQFSARRYGFVWETTLLDSGTFVSLTQALGWLPAMVGFPVPDIDSIRASGTNMLADEGVRQAWAGWLIGVVLLYGAAPRLLLALFCFWRWTRGVSRLNLDLEQPGYRLLRERLQPSSERLGISDADPGLAPLSSTSATVSTGNGAVLVAIELDSSRPWPPKLPEAIADAGVLDTREERRRLLDQLVRFPPARLAIACDPQRSPDRGTLALIAELARTAASSRVWLLPAAPGIAIDSDRLNDWHQGLERLAIPYRDSAPMTWLETGHD